ncbi:MAG TPA: phosphatase PAP2 family protein, partial [Micrococcaceae bacterium]
NGSMTSAPQPAQKGPANPAMSALRRGLGEPGFEPRRRKRLYATGAGLLVVGVVLFLLVLAAVTSGGGLALLDQPSHDWLVAHRNPLLTGVLEAVTTVSSPTYLTVIGIGFALLWAWRSRQLWRPGLLMAAMVATVALSYLVKHQVIRHRPPTSQMLMGPDDAFSFPSGHTMGAAVFLLVLSYLLLSRLSAPVRLAPWVVAAVVVVVGVLTVALSRLYLGYHWLTDVTASMTLSLWILGLVIIADSWRPLARFGAGPGSVAVAEAEAGAGQGADRGTASDR